MINFLWRHTLCRLGLHRYGRWLTREGGPGISLWLRTRDCLACGYTDQGEMGDVP